MKKIINDPQRTVAEMLEGMAFAHGDLIRKLDNASVLVRKAKRPDKVALISGGGSGHEPAHGGFVGRGMLDAAVAGEVFTSPTPDQIIAGINHIKTEHGVLMIVKNYSGDVMNFDMAGEMAEMDGTRIAKVVVNDDVAVENSTYTTGRRGIAGTVFVHKIAGAMAERGGSLEEVLRVALKTNANIRSKGMALTPCVVPAVGRPTFELAEEEMEIGLGIHGEPGVKRTKIAPADEIVDALMDSIMRDLPFRSGDEVAVLVNGLGGTPLMELYIMARRVGQRCASAGISVYRAYVKEFMTSLEMAGASITLFKLDDELKSLLDDPAETPAFTQ
ncbi:MAG: dihydroxyacetone kinase subunit DhaK [Firmicutes bacterium]|jgi:dihydroxyacetone kinase-like protein|nr:dihydroxyacetone kinase subunit DhaK [Bacillota bacterium]